METTDTKATRTCPRCKGTGVRHSDAFEYGGRSYPARVDPCHACKGAKEFPALDVPAIVEAITTARGAGGTRRFRKSAPKHWGSGTSLADRRAYYVWRLARFHGGADVTMPMTAGLLSDGDPFQPELDRLSDLFAKKVFGTHLAAAARWGAALRGLEAPAGLPASAYPGGPVADGGKPAWEFPELT